MQVVPFNRYIKQDAVHDRIVQILGPEKAPSFISSLVGSVTTDDKLSQCHPGSLVSAALKTVEYHLPLGLGQVALVPYGRNVQVQIMKRGWTQFVMRSGEAEAIHSDDVRKGELIGYDRLRGVHSFSFIENEVKRNKLPIIGYFAYLELKNGFKKTEYWTVEKIEAHARKYSKAYQAYLADKISKANCFWANDERPEMMRKTVLLRLLREWAPMSTTFAGRFADALKVDQAVFKQDGTQSFADNPRSDEAIEAEIIEAEVEFTGEKKPAPKPRAKKATKAEPVSPTPPTQEEIDEFAAMEQEEAKSNGEEEASSDDLDWGA